MSYKKDLQSPKWQKKRKTILNRDNYTCQSCSDNETILHVHHLKYGVGKAWEVPNSWLITFCENCHMAAHVYKTDYRIIDKLIELNNK